MLHVIRADTHLEHGEGSFRIRRVRPGLGIDDDDTGFGPLGLVDRARLSGGHVVEMHEHVDDEIVSYLRSGALVHIDSTGQEETVTSTRLMVMNAGSGFSHEERMADGEDIDMLQIFVRPRSAGLEPDVRFATLDEGPRAGAWRPLVRPDDVAGDAPATVRQDVFLHDARVTAGASIELPARAGFDQWLYVFDGRIELPQGHALETGDAVAAGGEGLVARVDAIADSELVLFELRDDARFTLAGSLSRGR